MTARIRLTANLLTSVMCVGVWLAGIDHAHGQFGKAKPTAGKGEPKAPAGGPIGEPGAKTPPPRPGKAPPKANPEQEPPLVEYGPALPPRPNAAEKPRRPNPNAMVKSPIPPLSAAQQEALDGLLAQWEERCSKITTYQCAFEKWEFDPVHGPADPNVHKSYAKGMIRYAKPDKGMIHSKEVSLYQPPPVDKPKAQPTYKLFPEMEEKWICDGKALFEFNFRDKVLVERPLPESEQGKSVADGPLPFMFNAEAAKMKERYWLRVVTPGDIKGEHWIEAYPKRARDLDKHSRVTIILSIKDFLPAALEICDPSYRPREKETRTSYKFGEREVNKFELGAKINLFHKEFFEPTTPSGWKRSVEPFPVDDPDVVQRPEPAKSKAPR